MARPVAAVKNGRNTGNRAEAQILEVRVEKLSKKNIILSIGAAASLSALIYSFPAVGQKGPESLLPSDFRQPPTPPSPTAATPPASTPGSEGTPEATKNANGSGTVRHSPKKSSAAGSTSSASGSTTSTVDTAKPGEAETGEPQEYVLRFDVPPSARRSLKQVGVFSAVKGAFAEAAFGSTDGGFLMQALRATHGPLASRWGTIIGRRLLAGRSNTPVGVDGADWVAERAWLLLRMGDADGARQLIQQVDVGSYSKRLHEVAMPVYLANADLSGICPIVESGSRDQTDGTWQLGRAICASLAGEQGQASSLLNQARKKKYLVGIDYLLAEKAVGAGMNGRRTVKIEWSKVKGFNAWRFGLAQATGMEPPATLYAQAGRHVDAWRAQLPAIPAGGRLASADTAAGLGVISNAAIVDLYSQALDAEDSSEEAKERAEKLQATYTAKDDNTRIAALNNIWQSADGDLAKSGAYVLTARAASLVSPGTGSATDADGIVASLMSAGLDNQAAAWGSHVASGSSAWAQLVTGAPELGKPIAYGGLDDFYDNDQSENAHRSALLVASLAGLDRLEDGAEKDFADKLEIDLHKNSEWASAIDAAAARGESGTVMLLSMAALQGTSWKKIPSEHVFHIVSGLFNVGMEAEARMIAAEAVVSG